MVASRFLGRIDSFHLLWDFDPGLGLGGFGCLGPEAADEVLVVGDLPLLVAIGGEVLGFPLRFLSKVLVEVPKIATDPAVADFEDSGADGIEKGPVVGNGQDRAGKFFEPVPGTSPGSRGRGDWWVRPASAGRVPSPGNGQGGPA